MTMKLKLIILTTLFTLSLALAVNALAVDSTASAEPNPEEVKQAQIDRLKKILDEDLDQAQDTINKSKERAVVGIIESLNQNEITVVVNPGKGEAEYHHQVLYSADTELIKAGKSIEPESLSIGDYLIATGLPTNDSILNAEKIITAQLTEPKFNTEIAYASIDSLDEDAETITLTGNHPSLGEFDYTSKTDLLTPNQEELEFTKLSPGQKVVAILTLNVTKKTSTLSSLIVFPGQPESATQNEATSSASCGDNICQNVSCFGSGCPTPETPETCPADCTL